MLTISEFVADPADMIGPTITATPPARTLSVEPMGHELCGWLTARGLDATGDVRLVLRVEHHIEDVFPADLGTAETLPHIGQRIQGTWQAHFQAVTS